MKRRNFKDLSSNLGRLIVGSLFFIFGLPFLLVGSIVLVDGISSSSLGQIFGGLIFTILFIALACIGLYIIRYILPSSPGLSVQFKDVQCY